MGNTVKNKEVFGWRYTPATRPRKASEERRHKLSFYTDIPERKVSRGHAFVGLEPKSGPQVGRKDLIYGRHAGTENLVSTVGTVQSDKDHAWDWKVTYPVNTKQYNAATSRINKEINGSQRFHLYSTNCAEFNHQVALAAGVRLPKTRNLLRTHDPIVFARNLESVGHGGKINGGIVKMNPLMNSFTQGHKQAVV